MGQGSSLAHAHVCELRESVLPSVMLELMIAVWLSSVMASDVVLTIVCMYGLLHSKSELIDALPENQTDVHQRDGHRPTACAVPVTAFMAPD